MAHHLELFAILSALSLSYSMLVRYIEQLRRALKDGYVAHSLDVWIMVGVLLLPPLYLSALVPLVYLGEWPSRKIVDSGRPRRYLISACINLVAALAGLAVHGTIPGLFGLLAVVLAWSVVNDVLIVGVMTVGGSRKDIRRLLSSRNHIFDLATKIAGVLLAPLVAWQAPLAAAAVPLLLLGHRLALRDSIRETAAFDPATGLWSEDGWRIHAEQIVARAPASVALMLIDPVLARQEETIRSALAGLFDATPMSTHDDSLEVRYVVGRYGTRQVGLLSEVDVPGAGVLLARHVRDQLRTAGVDCVVGGAVGCAVDFDELLIRAGEDLMCRRARAGVSARW